MARVGILQHLAVDFTLNVQLVRIFDLVRRRDPRSHRAERVEGLAHQPLRRHELEIARTDVVDTGVAEDVLAPGGSGNVPPAGTDHDSEFSLVIRLAGVFRQHDRRARAGDRRAEFAEDGRHLRNLHLGLGRVVAVVQPHADDLGRLGDRREQRDGAERDGRRRGRAGEKGADRRQGRRAARDYIENSTEARRLQALDPVANDDPRQGRSARHGVGHEAHGSMLS